MNMHCRGCASKSVKYRCIHIYIYIYIHMFISLYEHMYMMMVDIAIYSPHAKSCKNAFKLGGVAAKAVEKAKLVRYGPSVHPLVFESHGRLGAASLQTLEELASWAAAASHGQRVREASLTKPWRLSLETVLIHEKADLLIQSLGGCGARWCSGS